MGDTQDLLGRDRCGYYGNIYYGDCNNGWYHWGRWILAGVALLLFILVLLFLCIQARRRRKHGARPYYGTGWMAPPGKFGVPQQDSYGMNTYYNQPQSAGQGYTVQPPPTYGQSQSHPQFTQPTGTAAEYYRHEPPEGGVIEPPNSYQRDSVYPPAPPASAKQ